MSFFNGKLDVTAEPKAVKKFSYLSKAAIAAVVIVGTGSIFFAGSAKAWVAAGNGFTCAFDGGNTSSSCIKDVSTDPVPVGVLGVDPHKILTLLDWSNVPAGIAGSPPAYSDANFFYDPVGNPAYPWHVDFDFEPLATSDGYITYKIESTEGAFSGVQFTYSPVAGGSATKTYGTSYDPVTKAIDGIVNSLSLNQVGLASGTVLYVKDEWVASPGNTVDNVVNNFSQVPGPLPLFGAGAAFGFSRKIRSRIKKARLV